MGPSTVQVADRALRPVAADKENASQTRLPHSAAHGLPRRDRPGECLITENHLLNGGEGVQNLQSLETEGTNRGNFLTTDE